MNDELRINLSFTTHHSSLIIPMLSTDLIKKIRQIEIYTRRLVNDNFAGEYHAIFKGRGMEFDEVRPYQLGDEIRTIDWNVTARTGEPHVKRYVEERELTVMLVVDASGSQDFGSVKRFKREVAAELVAVLSFAATTNNDRVGLLIFTDRIELIIPPRKGRHHVLRLIRALLTFQPQGRQTDIRLALDTVNRILKRRSIIFLVSDFLINSTNYQQAMFVTNRRHDLVALDLHDPLESNLGDGSKNYRLGWLGRLLDFFSGEVLVLEDAESDEVKQIDIKSKVWQDAFAKQVKYFENEKNHIFRRCGVDCIPVSNLTDYVPALTNFFRNRSRRLRR